MVLNFVLVGDKVLVFRKNTLLRPMFAVDITQGCIAAAGGCRQFRCVYATLSRQQIDSR